MLSWKTLSTYRNQLMGLSILWVVLFHFYEINKNVPNMTFATEIINFCGKYGNLGVEIFLILSGLGCFFSYSKNSRYLAFIKARCKRILLPYIFIAGPFWLLKSIVLDDLSFIDAVLNFLGITFFTNGVRTFWYVLFIIIMYIIFPIIYKIVTLIKGDFKILLIIGVYNLLLIAYSFYDPEFSRLISVMSTRVISFITGVYIGERIKTNPKISPVTFICFILCLGLFFIQFDSREFILYRFVSYLEGLAVVVIVAHILSVIRYDYIHKLLIFIGSYSYELYLTHIAFRRLLISVGFINNEPYKYWYVIILSIIMSLCVNRLTTKILDRKRRLYV